MIFCQRMRRARMALIRVALLALPLLAWGRRLPVQTFTVAEGLPRNAFSCLAPGPTGVMWLCSSEGLIRYDGSGFRVFGKESGLPATVVGGALPAHSGGLWLFTSRGVCRLEKSARIGEPCPAVPGSEPCTTLRQGMVFLNPPHRLLWFASGGRLFEIMQPSTGQRTLRPTSFVSLAMNRSKPSGTRRLEACTSAPAKGFMRSRKHQTYQRQITPRVMASGGSRRYPSERGDNTVWVATTEGLARLSEGEKPELLLAFPLRSFTHQIVQRRDVVPSGSAMTAALIRFDPVSGSREEYTSRDGLPAGYLLGLAEDSFGDLWGLHRGHGNLP